MPLRASEIIVGPDGRRVRHQGVAGHEHRLVGALLRDDGDGTARPSPIVIGSAWRDPAGAIFWGWTDEEGGTLLRTAPEGSWKSCLLPPALSLALSMRRRGTDLGSHALVVGEGFMARLALAVATTLGCRGDLVSAPGTAGMAEGPEADIVIETTGDGGSLDRALSCCRDWGVVYSMGGGLAHGPHDYYQHVHRRALTVIRVPDRPVVLAGEAEVAGRGAGLLVAAVEAIAVETGASLRAVIEPGDIEARLLREGGGWAVLQVTGP